MTVLQQLSHHPARCLKHASPQTRDLPCDHSTACACLPAACTSLPAACATGACTHQCPFTCPCPLPLSLAPCTCTFPLPLRPYTTPCAACAAGGRPLLLRPCTHTTYPTIRHPCLPPHLALVGLRLCLCCLCCWRGAIAVALRIPRLTRCLAVQVSAQIREHRQ